MTVRSGLKCAAIALALFALAASSTKSANAQTTTDLIYCALSKNVVDGRGTAKYLKQYKCTVPPGPNGQVKEMRKVSLPLTLPFQPHDCDEDGLPGYIKTTWTIVLRVGPAPAGGGFIPFGTHAGGGTYTDTAGNVIRVSFNGTVGCGTHRDPFVACEKCREHLHFEGLLTGAYVSGPIFNTYSALGLPAPKIKASYAGAFGGNLWPTAQTPSVATTVKMAIEGVYIFNCGG